MIFFKRKYSNSSEVNVGLPTTNVAIPTLENMDAPILENIHSPIPKKVYVPIPKNIHSPIPKNADISIPKNNHISQTQFQKVDLDSLDYDPGTHKQIWEYRANQTNEIWVFVSVDSLLIQYGCVFEKKNSLITSPLA